MKTNSLCSQSVKLLPMGMAFFQEDLLYRLKFQAGKKEVYTALNKKEQD